jgi:hypothetical protein
VAAVSRQLAADAAERRQRVRQVRLAMARDRPSARSA